MDTIIFTLFLSMVLADFVPSGSLIILDGGNFGWLGWTRICFRWDSRRFLSSSYVNTSTSSIYGNFWNDSKKTFERFGGGGGGVIEISI